MFILRPHLKPAAVQQIKAMPSSHLTKQHPPEKLFKFVTPLLFVESFKAPWTHIAHIVPNLGPGKTLKNIFSARPGASLAHLGHFSKFGARNKNSFLLEQELARPPSPSFQLL